VGRPGTVSKDDQVNRSSHRLYLCDLEEKVHACAGGQMEYDSKSVSRWLRWLNLRSLHRLLSETDGRHELRDPRLDAQTSLCAVQGTDTLIGLVSRAPGRCDET
jgi:hypothetical protein